MPAYNAARYIDSAIATVRDQTFTNWELLIVDDASSDETYSLAENWASQDERIQALKQSRNGGVAKARNLALEHASGKFIAFLDSDDLWEPDKLQQQVSFMERENCLICYSHYRRIDEQGGPLGVVKPPNSVTYKKLLQSNFIGNLTGIYNQEILGKEYLTDFRHEDYVAWLELVKRAGEARGIPEVLASYRVYSGSTSSNKLRTILWQWKIYRYSQSIGLIRSSWLMVLYALNALKKRSG